MRNFLVNLLRRLLYTKSRQMRNVVGKLLHKMCINFAVYIPLVLYFYAYKYLHTKLFACMRVSAINQKSCHSISYDTNITTFSVVQILGYPLSFFNQIEFYCMEIGFEFNTFIKINLCSHRFGIVINFRSVITARNCLCFYKLHIRCLNESLLPTGVNDREIKCTCFTESHISYNSAVMCECVLHEMRYLQKVRQIMMMMTRKAMRDQR